MKPIPYLTIALISVIFLLPQPAEAYSEDSAMVPMADGIHLATQIYIPDFYPTPLPVVLQRTPYNRRDESMAMVVCDFLGYVFVSQNVRGRYESEGEPMVFFTDGWGEHRDGYDCIDWIVDQDWCNGRVGMMGASAPGMTQYMASGSRHPNLSMNCPILAGPSMYHFVAYQGGVFRKALVESWLTGLDTPWLIDTVTNHPDYDDTWATVDLSARYDSATVPTFHIAGWFDMYTDGQIEAFAEMQTRFGNNKLLIAPCGHGDAIGTVEQGDLVFPDNALLTVEDLVDVTTRWYDYWLKDIPTGIMDEPAIQFYLTGDCDTGDTTLFNRWMFAEEWPLPEIATVPYYIKADGALDTIPPTGDGSDTYLYDPENPCPTIGGREFIGMDEIGYGPKDQAALVESRSDVLIYTTPVLTEPMAIIGKIIMILYASSDRLDTDFAVRVTDVYPDGRSILMTDGILMARHRQSLDAEEFLVPDMPDTFEIDVWSIANVFNTGHRIRVIISSSNYPRFEANPNTGAPFVRDDTVTLVATNTVFRSAAMPSHLLLPIYPLDTAAHIVEGRNLPENLEISAWPNPFNSAITISIDCHSGEGRNPEGGVEIEIFDINGRIVYKTPVGAGSKPARITGGSRTLPYEITWQPDESVGSGVYLVRARIGDEQTTTRRVMYIK